MKRGRWEEDRSAEPGHLSGRYVAGGEEKKRFEEERQMREGKRGGRGGEDEDFESRRK